mmetsp:Transcript_71755/g.199079  ORF Transcript_71755/g.199079 Transcript_71755/m.199079 type:complete len:887 (+) Transcript_71755:58-2718(+)|eukprot:CAMPEP_0117492036 /NCGR_PEP_ID=MMETSP0784-20121206/18376_1 /TAXON_ID=39447 /ORGANISM="" /LENGTH=886 /DNA_ID=CAMNT_0005286847 /DNA_START=57 /DNA_END=2717 /DNA_ORIENTATION=+
MFAISARRLPCLRGATRGSRDLKARGSFCLPKSAVRGLAQGGVQDAIEARTQAAKQELVVLAQAFSRYDGHGSGALNHEDLKLALQDLDLPAGEVDVHQLFSELDLNKDGTVELTEWLDRLPKGTKLRIVEKMSRDGDYVSFRIPDVKIVYTHTDEAPMLATYSLLPVFRSFCRIGNVKLLKKDISVAGRILANFPDALSAEQRVDDDLEWLGKLAKNPAANIIKLPNISASIPQLTAAIAELQAKGYPVPDFPTDPQTDEDRDIRARYAKVLGSAVNPVLREGNSDRRCAGPVKTYAMKHPPRNGKWTADSKSHVSHMSDGDFFSTELSAVVEKLCSVRIELVSGGETTVLKAKTSLLPGEVIDASVMRVAALRGFYEQTLQTADKDTLWSLHLKATMMKISDPVFFGHAVEVFYKTAFEKHRGLFDELGVDSKNGLGDVYAKIAGHPKQAEVEADLMACYNERPPVAYVDSRRGITNLHVPSDVIVDASMAAAVRDSGRMWTKDDTLCDAKFVIPDRCYAGIYDAIIKDCQANGHLDASSCGHTSNVGLMAAKAEEYGSHDKTFVVPADGVVRVVMRKTGEVVFSHDVSKGDVWRMCQTKDSPIQDWVKLAVVRARTTSTPAIFWLTEDRAHDRNMIQKVHEYLRNHDTTGLDIRILAPEEAMRETLARARQGLDTISVTGNVLRDYLTDLFPILELGTSAKMLSIVPLLAGGGMYETGAGGSAPKHVQQFCKEGHLRWDSLGEFLAMAEALEDYSLKTGNLDSKVLSTSLSTAVGKLMNEGKSPKRKVMELDNRGSHFYLALYWAETLAAQTGSPSLAAKFKPVAGQLRASEAKILGELIAAEGKPVNVGGYYHPDPFLASQAMRPSPTFNSIVDALLAASGW